MKKSEIAFREAAKVASRRSIATTKAGGGFGEWMGMGAQAFMEFMAREDGSIGAEARFYCQEELDEFLLYAGRLKGDDNDGI